MEKDLNFIPEEDFIPDQETSRDLASVTSDFVPDSEFKPDQIKSEKPESEDFIPDDKFKSDDQIAQEREEKYGTTGQQIIAGLEGAAEGVLGPIAPAAEKYILGIKPEDIRGRAEENPLTHGISEAVGFGAGMLTGTGEAALLTKAGQGAVNALKLNEAASISGRLASSAARVGAEMGLMQASDEVSKVILDVPNSIGDAAVNVGLSTLLGAGGGAALKGLGMAAKTGLDGIGLKEFTDRLAYRGANLNPNEAVQHESENAYRAYHEMGSEVSGPSGLKAQAIEKLMPKSVTPEIGTQIQDVYNNAKKALEKMVTDGVPERYIKKFNNDVVRFQDVVTNPQASVSQYFDALNDFKKTLQDYSKGNFGPFSVPTYHEAYDFLNITKNLGREVRHNLEDSKVWGEVADLQKNLNKAWSEAIPAVKDFEKKFMTKVGDQLEIDPAKLNTYINQGGKATSRTVKQEMMGKFVDSVEKFSKATEEAYEKAGVLNPRAGNPIGMGALKDSLEKKSVGAKLADLWYDKMGAQAIGTASGAAAGHAVIPGLEGAYIGKEVLGPIFGAIIQPIMEKTANMTAYKEAMKFGKSVIAGNNALIRDAKSVFSGIKTVPQHAIADSDKIEKLDEQLYALEKNPDSMLNVAGNMGHYMPAHAESLAQTTMGAVNYLNSKRPRVIQNSPLDSKIEPSKGQRMEFHRTLSIAQNPLTIIKHIKNGTLLPTDIETLRTVYPSYYNKISQQLTTEMTDHLSKGETIPYATRQTLSMFLGQPLDSTMTPTSIHAAQMTFVNKSQPQQQVASPKTKKNTSKIGKISENMLTQTQKSEQRRLID